MLVSGDLSTSQFFLALDRELKIAIEKGDKKLKEEIDNIRAIGEKYKDDDYGFEQKNYAAGSWESDKERINQKVQNQKKLYTKACSIQIKENYLYLFITRLVGYNLSNEEKQALIKQEGGNCEILEIAGKKHLLFEVKTPIPNEFSNADPRDNEEFASWMLNRLRCNALCAVLMANEWKTDDQFEKV